MRSPESFEETSWFILLVHPYYSTKALIIFHSVVLFKVHVQLFALLNETLHFKKSKHKKLKYDSKLLIGSYFNGISGVILRYHDRFHSQEVGELF